MANNRKLFSSEGQDVHETGREPMTIDQEVDDSRATDRDHDNLSWSRSSNLDAPPPRPGYVQQWVRYEIDGKTDGPNLAKKLGPERWRPRRKETVPGGYSPATTSHAQLGDIIAAAGMVLCERPISVQQQRDAYYARVQQDQIDGINKNLFKEQNSAMPISKSHKTTVEGVKRKVDSD